MKRILLVLMILGSLYGEQPQFNVGENWVRRGSRSAKKADTSSVIPEVFTGKAGKLPFCRLECNMEQNGEPYLIMILHGNEGNGSDNAKQLSSPAFAPIRQYVEKKKIKAVILLPQNPGGDWNTTLLAELFRSFTAKYSIPLSRCSLAGAYEGGTACYRLMAAESELAARAAVASADGIPVREITGDFYIVHGSMDRNVKPARAKLMADKLIKVRGNHVRYVVLPGKNHSRTAQTAFSEKCMKFLFPGAAAK